MPAKDAPKTPAQLFARSGALKFPSAIPFEDGFQAAPPAFASAADTLRAKIRACAARSFAAQHKAAERAASTKNDKTAKREAGIAAGQNARGIKPEGLRAHS